MRGISQERRRQVIWGYAFLAPALALFALIVVYPLLYALWLGFYDWPVFGEKTFVGLGNYARMLSDPLFRKSLANTVYWTCCVVPATVVISLAVALLLEAKFLKGRGLFRTIYFIPVVTSMVGAAFAWKWLFEPTFGLSSFRRRRQAARSPWACRASRSNTAPTFTGRWPGRWWQWLRSSSRFSCSSGSLLKE